MKSLSNEALFFLQEVLGFLYFGSYQNCKSSVNLVVEIHQELWNKRALSTGEACTCEYVTFGPLISQMYIKYTLVHSSKLLGFLFHVRPI